MQKYHLCRLMQHPPPQILRTSWEKQPPWWQRPPVLRFWVIRQCHWLIWEPNCGVPELRTSAFGNSQVCFRHRRPSCGWWTITQLGIQCISTSSFPSFADRKREHLRRHLFAEAEVLYCYWGSLYEINPVFYGGEKFGSNPSPSSGGATVDLICELKLRNPV